MMAGTEETLRNAAAKLAGLVRREDKAPDVQQATVTRVDPDGTVWVSIAGSGTETPVRTGMAAGVGDMVSVRLVGGAATITDNVTRPATDDKVALDAMSYAMDAQDIADQASEVAGAIGQHFFADERGVHVASAEGDGDTGRNVILNSLGMVFRNGLTNLLAVITGSTAQPVEESERGVAVYDGLGNAKSNIVAFFGRFGIQLGRDGDKHVSINEDGLSIVNPDGGYADVNGVDVVAAAGDASSALAAASKTKENFWADSSGVHVSTQANAAAGTFNSLFTSTSIAFRKAARKLMELTGTSLDFYDGAGEAAANKVASFGADGVQLGKSSGNHVTIGQDGLSIKGGTGAYANVNGVDVVATSATAAAAKEAVDNLAVGGRNLLLGTQDAKTVTLASATADYYIGYFEESDFGKSMTNGNTSEYMCVAFDWSTTSATGCAWLQIDGNIVSSIKEAGGYGSLKNMIDLSRGSGRYWAVFKLTATQAGKASQRMRLRIAGSNTAHTAGSSFTLKNLKFEMGSKPTTYSPAPEDVSASVAEAQALAAAADGKATATQQHFWADSGGVHVSTQAATAAGAFNSLFASTGLLFRKASNNLLSLTASALNFYDGSGNADANVTASFGSDSMRLGKVGSGKFNTMVDASGIHLRNDTADMAALTATALDFYDASGASALNLTTSNANGNVRVGRADKWHTLIGQSYGIQTKDAEGTVRMQANNNGFYLRNAKDGDTAAVTTAELLANGTMRLGKLADYHYYGTATSLGLYPGGNNTAANAVLYADNTPSVRVGALAKPHLFVNETSLGFYPASATHATTAANANTGASYLSVSSTPALRIGPYAGNHFYLTTSAFSFTSANNNDVGADSTKSFMMMNSSGVARFGKVAAGTANLKVQSDGMFLRDGTTDKARFFINKDFSAWVQSIDSPGNVWGGFIPIQGAAQIDAGSSDGRLAILGTLLIGGSSGSLFADEKGIRATKLAQFDSSAEVFGELSTHGSLVLRKGARNAAFVGVHDDTEGPRIQSTYVGWVAHIEGDHAVGGNNLEWTCDIIKTHPAEFDHGHAIILEGGGLTFVGGGEAGASLYTIYGGYSKNTDENLHLGADSTVYVHSNCNTVANRKTWVFKTDGTLQCPDIVSVSKSSGNTWLAAKRTDTNVMVTFGVGQAGINHGVYSDKQSKWLLYGDATDIYVGSLKMTNAAAARASIGVGTIGTKNSLAASDLPTVTVAKGGTGATSVNAAKRNLGLAKTAGDSLTGLYWYGGGFITNGKKDCRFTMPLGVHVYGVNNVGIVGTIQIRGNGYYLWGSGAGSELQLKADGATNVSGVTYTAWANAVGLLHVVVKGGEQGAMTNNAAVGVMLDNVTISFS